MSDQATRQPRSRRDLFLSFSALSLQGFGGVVAVAQRELVERKGWLTNAEFVEDWAVAQVMPGANVVNLSMIIGARYFGLSGALAAIAGMIALPLGIVLVLGYFYSQFASDPHVAGALRGMGAVAAGMIIATGLKMAKVMKASPLGAAGYLTVFALSFIAVALLRWHLAAVLLGLGAISCVATYRKLRP